MKKYLVPCAALVGIALLTPRADAANLVIKSRAVPAGGNISVPVLVNTIGPTSNLELWGIDMALAFNNAALSAQDPANAFVPTTTATSDVVVTGNTFVGGGTQPSLYVGYVRGASGLTGAPAIGLLKLKVAAGTALKTVIDDAPIASYNVKNDGTGNDVSRLGTTAVTSTATAGAPVVAEAVTVVPTSGGIVPLHKIAVGKPGDPTGDGLLTVSDVALMKSIILNTAGARTDYRLIASDVAPLNGYTPTAVGGTTGAGYGDNNVTVADVSSLKSKLLNTNPNFPVPE